MGERFRRLISSFECDKFEECWVSHAIGRKRALVLKVFDQWRVETNEAALKENYSGDPLIDEKLSEMSQEQLDFVLARFISEVRREDGQQ